MPSITAASGQTWPTRKQGQESQLWSCSRVIPRPRLLLVSVRALRVIAPARRRPRSGKHALLDPLD